MNQTEFNLYGSVIHCMTPERGYIASEQDRIFITDIDFKSKETFDLIIYKDLDRHYYFTKSDCCTINPYQKKFTLKFNKKYLNLIDSLFVYGIKNGKLFKVDLNKKIRKQSIEYTFEEDQINNFSTLIFSEKKDKVDLNYDLKINVVNNIACKIYIDYQLEGLIKAIDKVFFEENLSGNLYRTQNGFRIILNNKFFNLKIEKERLEAIRIMENLNSDPVYVYMYKNLKYWEEYRGNVYGLRLSPKLKNYKLFNNSYEKIISKLECLQNEDVAVSYLEEEAVPIKYDLKNVKYNKNSYKNSRIENTFELFKNLVLSYLENPNYSVCHLVKKYNYSKSTAKEILEFIGYHDKWTKCLNKDSILI